MEVLPGGEVELKKQAVISTPLSGQVEPSTQGVQYVPSSQGTHIPFFRTKPGIHEHAVDPVLPWVVSLGGHLVHVSSLSSPVAVVKFLKVFSRQGEHAPVLFLLLSRNHPGKQRHILTL